MLVHDRVLRTRPELLDAVSAAAGFALANERALETLQRMEVRNSALLDAIPDLVFRIGRDGTYLDVQPDDSATLPVPAEELIGMNVRDLLPPEIAEHELATIAQALDSGAMTSAEYELKIEGVPRHFELRMVPSGEGEVVTIVRDFTEQRRNEREQRRLGEEQAALRRVATLVAADIPPEQVFQNVTEEVCRLLGIPSAVLERFEGDETATVVARYGERVQRIRDRHGDRAEEGSRVDRRPANGSAGAHRELRRCRRRDRRARARDGRRVLGCGADQGRRRDVGRSRRPVRRGRAASRRTPSVACRRSPSSCRSGSRARTRATSSRRRDFASCRPRDAERRRLERNLHDGAQQRLVGLAVALRLAQDRIRHAARRGGASCSGPQRRS